MRLPRGVRPRFSFALACRPSFRAFSAIVFFSLASLSLTAPMLSFGRPPLMVAGFVRDSAAHKLRQICAKGGTEETMLD